MGCEMCVDVFVFDGSQALWAQQAELTNAAKVVEPGQVEAMELPAALVALAWIVVFGVVFVVHGLALIALCGILPNGVIKQLSSLFVKDNSGFFIGHVFQNPARQRHSCGEQFLTITAGLPQ